MSILSALGLLVVTSLLLAGAATVWESHKEKKLIQKGVIPPPCGYDEAQCKHLKELGYKSISIKRIRSGNEGKRIPLVNAWKIYESL